MCTEYQLQIIEISVTAFLGIATIAFTILAVSNAKSDNRLTSYIDIVTGFINGRSLITSRYQPGFKGEKLFDFFELDLRTIHRSFIQDPHQGLQHLHSTKSNLTRLVNSANSLTDKYDVYVKAHSSEIDHYMDFFIEVLPALLAGLNKSQRNIIIGILRVNISISEWKFLFYYFNIKGLSKNTQLIRLAKPDLVKDWEAEIEEFKRQYS